ncbi:MAG: DNA photolyase family protein, partial [Anaerolineae bacterium]|nr:DNA photolyase family protein [Anaerolineae bacterium]
FAASEKRLAFLFGGLRALDADLRARGSRLIVRRGDPATELARLVSETGATAVFAEEDVWPYARRRDTAVAALAPLRLTAGLTIHPSDVVRKADGGVYTVFTPYSRAWKALPPPRRSDLLTPQHLASQRLGPAVDLASLPIPDKPVLPASVPFPPGELEALRRLAAFTGLSPRSSVARPPSSVHHYADDRNRMDLEGTSRLSPYLRFGMISARQCAVAALEALASAPNDAARPGATTWLNELIWREFYTAILYHFPNVLQEAFQPELRAIPWSNDPAQFAAWCEGRTGYPIVDAAMQQLVETGWMHNRARMIVASFLVKDLLIDWRWGERFFMEHLIDGDPAANNGGWQWTAGVGTDAAPYFRVFNPTLQAARFDPDGAYVRRWLPELARVPARHIHAPWLMPPDVQRQAGCIIGQDYPAPIVDHATARERVLAAYKTR